MPVGENATFTKYKTFPNDFDAEEYMLKIEAWLYLIWDGIDPIDWLWSIGWKGEDL